MTKRKKAELSLNQSEEKYRILAETAQDIIYVINRDDYVEYVNTFAAKLFRSKPEDIIGKPRTDLFPPDIAEKQKNSLQKVFETGESFHAVDKHTFLEREIWLDTRLVPLKNETGEIMAVMGLSRDITERKQTELALQESERRFREMLKNIQLIAVIMDLSGNISFCNDYLLNLTGWKWDEVIGQNWFDIFLPSRVRDTVRRLFFNTILSNTIPHHNENEIQTRDGKERLILWDTTVLLTTKGNIMGTASIGMDITENRQMESALRQSEEKYRTVAETAQDLIYIINRDDHIEYVNSFAARQFGCRPEDLIGKPRWNLFPSDVSSRQKYSLQKVFETGETVHIESKQPFPDRLSWQDTHLVPLKNKAGEVRAVMGVSRDITERKEMEETLRRSEEKFFKVFNTSPDAMTITRISDDIFLEVNEGFLKLMGYTAEEVVGKPAQNFQNWVKQEDRARLLEELTEHGEVTDRETSFVCKNGHTIIALMSAKILEVHGEQCILTITRDITERKHLEEQLQQSQKMEAIGQLAGGVAHDFNNLLTGILGYANILKLESEPGSTINDAAVTIEKAGERAAELVKKLLGFARRGKFFKTLINLNDIVREVTGLLNRTINKNIIITERLYPDTPTITGEPGQIQQAILNLAVNARDAMPEGGELTIETKTVLLDEEYCRIHLDVTPGRYAMISVTDTGYGIPRDIRERIFEPFFTTKEVGKGTGMGLAMVYGIVKNHGGFIRVHSEAGYGATFQVYLPVEEELKERVDIQKKDPTPGKGRILLVDDEEIILNVVSRVLRSLGYEVETAVNGKEALDYYQEFGHQIDLIIIDMVMPIMGGKECYKAIKRLNPNVAAIVSTGYGLDCNAQEIVDEGGIFIQKPYKISELSEAIIKALKK